MTTTTARLCLSAIALTLAAISGCSVFGSAPAPPTVAPDPAAQPYPRGQFTVTHPKRSFGVDLCGLLTPAEKTALIGPHLIPEPGSGGNCDLHGDHGDVLFVLNPYNIDIVSEVNTSDRPPHRDTLSGNSAWVSPSSTGCSVEIAIDPNPGALSLAVGGDGSFTCDQVRHAAQLVLDRLPARP